MIRNRYQAFYQQKRWARINGIAFLFEYHEWMAWWLKELGPDWRNLRGRGKGKFCMARNGDTGPYHPDNVQCILNEQNVRDSWASGLHQVGEACQHAKLSGADVRAIYHMKGLQKEIAKKFGISAPMVSHIKNGKHWKQLPK